MKLIRLGTWSVVCLMIGLASLANARPVQYWPYKRLLRESDLVVIAEAVTSEASQDVFPDSNPWGIGIKGIVTLLKVKLVVKGSEASKEIRLMHFQFGPPDGNSPPFITDGPTFVKFEAGSVQLKSESGKELAGKPDYLLFLKKRVDGRYEAISGQTDPSFSVHEMYSVVWQD